MELGDGAKELHRVRGAQRRICREGRIGDGSEQDQGLDIHIG
jgi:hypothetical protein